MYRFPILLKREFWEHRATFFYLPALMTAAQVGILMLVGMGLQFDLIQITVTERQEDGIERHIRVESDRTYDGESAANLFGLQLQRMARSPLERREADLDTLYTGAGSIMMAVLWFVVLFYFAGCLYEDRKDRSVLFWKSLPVSDALTVLSKLATGLFLAPAIYLGFIILGNIALLFISSFAALGQSVDIWETLWVPANLVTRWFNTGLFILYSALWCLPFAGWVLLISSWARSATLAWIFGIPILLLIIEYIFTSSHILQKFFSSHLVIIDRRDYFPGGFGLEMLTALLIGGAFIFLTIWQRGKENEI